VPATSAGLKTHGKNVLATPISDHDIFKNLCIAKGKPKAVGKARNSICGGGEGRDEEA
jgi:hypothetical protein